MESASGSSRCASHHIGEGIFATKESLENLMRISAELILMRKARMTAAREATGAATTWTATTTTAF